MIRITPDEISKWRIEIANSEKFRDENLGEMKYSTVSRSGENLDYFETGVSGRMMQDYGLKDNFASINLIYPIVKNVIPTIYWKNPYINVVPKKSEDDSSAPYVGAILNYYFDELDLKNVNRQIIFDAYVIGMGVCKIGYATQFGTDIPDKDLEKNREKEKERSFLEKIGLKKPKKEEDEKVNVDINEFIRSESPYVVWISPFDFLIDPTAKSIYDAQWVGHKVVKKLSEVKNNPGYSNTTDLKGSPTESPNTSKIPETSIDDFKTVDLYEIHYKQEDGIYILTLARDGEDYKALRHEKSIYKMDGFQFEVLYFNKHNHKLYPKSDIDIVKGLQDRVSLTFENILDQIDKYVPKLFVDETAVTEQGKLALRDGDIGSIVFTNKSPGEVVKEGNFTQIKADLSVFIDKILDLMGLETGLTRAQLTGMTNAQTATEAQIGQAGQSLRMSDKFDAVSDFSNKQARKLWQVIQQFVDFEELELITGDQVIDEVTGLPKFSWIPEINSDMAEKLTKGEYRFKIEVGSTEKPDLPILRQQIERMAGVLQQPGVLQAFQAQGYKINLAEIFKRYLNLYPDVFKDVGKIIQPITPNTQGLISPAQQPGRVGNINSQQRINPPNMADIISSVGGEKGQSAPPLA